MNNTKGFFIVMIFAVVAFAACKSTKGFEGNANLTILIVDENDRAVDDFEISLCQNKKVIPDFESCVSTNKNGLCVFYNIAGGEYVLQGQKNGYSKIAFGQFDFNNRSDLYCYRVYSADFILDQTEQLYKKGEYQKALELLEKLCTQEGTLLQNTVAFYKAYGYACLDQKEKAGLELQNITEQQNPAFNTTKYCGAIEQIIEQLPNAQPDA